MARFQSLLFIKSTGFERVKLHEVDSNEHLCGYEIKIWWRMMLLWRWKVVSSRLISKVFQWFLYMDLQHVNDLDQAWPYNTQFREMSPLRRRGDKDKKYRIPWRSENDYGIENILVLCRERIIVRSLGMLYHIL